MPSTGDADAVEVEGAGHRAEQLVGQAPQIPLHAAGGRRALAEDRHEDTELVAAQAGDQPVALAGEVERGRHPLEEHVTLGVAEGAVDVSEPVQVDEQQPHLASAASRGGKGGGGGLGQGEAVGQAGEGVGALAVVALGHVPDDAGEEHGPVLGPRRQRQLGGELGAVGALCAHLHGATHQVLRPATGHPLDPSTVSSPRPSGDDQVEGPAQRCQAGVAEDALGAVVPRHDHPLGVDRDHGVERGLGLEQAALGLPALGDPLDGAERADKGPVGRADQCRGHQGGHQVAVGVAVVPLAHGGAPPAAHEPLAQALIGTAVTLPAQLGVVQADDLARLTADEGGEGGVHPLVAAVGADERHPDRCQLERGPELLGGDLSVVLGTDLGVEGVAQAPGGPAGLEQGHDLAAEGGQAAELGGVELAGAGVEHAQRTERLAPGATSGEPA